MVNSLLKKKLNTYKKKYIVNELIRGSILFLSVILISFLTITSLELNFRLDSIGRAFLFYGFIVLFVIIFYILIFKNIISFIAINSRISDEEAAKQIGSYFPSIDDKLLNVLQLHNLTSNDSTLILASIDQKIEEIKVFSFSNAIDFKVNLKYNKILIPIVLSFILAIVAFPDLYKEAPKRIANYQKHYVVTAPFTFNLELEDLNAFKDENINITLLIEGDEIPAEAFILINNRSIKLKNLSVGRFNYVFDNVQRDIKFSFFAAGFYSKEYLLKIYERPELLDFKIDIDFPSHTEKIDEEIVNSGNLTIPEGSRLTWYFSTRSTDSLSLEFNNNMILSTNFINNKLVSNQIPIVDNVSYDIKMYNGYSTNRDKLSYKIDVIKDQYPTVDVNYFADTILLEYIIVTGSSFDDYGISQLEINYKINNVEKIIPLKVNPNQNQQSYYYKLDLIPFLLNQNDKLDLFVKVYDNDVVNGFKSSISQTFSFKIPSVETIKNNLSKKSENTEKQIFNSIEDAENINEKLKKLEERLKSKSSLEWQEEKLLDDLLKQRQKMQEEIEKLKENFSDLRQSEDKFTERSQRIKEKAEMLQQIMNEILDEETKKMYEELQKLLEEKSDIQNLRDQLSKISPNEQNMEKELERALELFKRLKLETKLEKVSDEIKELAKKQNELGNDLDKNKSENEKLEEQNEISDSFKEIEEKIEEIQDLNQELKNPEPLEDTRSEQEDINKSLQEIQKELENTNNALEKNDKKIDEKQRKVGDNMMKLGEKLENMQASMEMEMMIENMEQLQNILDDLVKLSFKQEYLVDEFKTVQQVDPRFVELSQDQLKLKDDSKVIEDSLLALAQRVVQISSFVTREVSEVNRNVDNALNELKDRDRGKALSSQQFAMTSINNLALLLDNVLQQMQMAMGSPSKGEDKKGGKGLPDLKQLQKQLSEKIENLKKSGLQGRELSEELVKMAAEQEMLREKLAEMQKELAGQPGNKGANDNLGKVIEEMENNEFDLVNKQLTQELIQRQELIMTRLLEAEDAMREQELDHERKGETANTYERKLPKAFEDYLKAKEKEIELMKSIPLDLNPFYKKEVNDYFRRLSNDN